MNKFYKKSIQLWEGRIRSRDLRIKRKSVTNSKWMRERSLMELGIIALKSILIKAASASLTSAKINHNMMIGCRFQKIMWSCKRMKIIQKLKVKIHIYIRFRIRELDPKQYVTPKQLLWSPGKTRKTRISFIILNITILTSSHRSQCLQLLEILREQKIDNK